MVANRGSATAGAYSIHEIWYWVSQMQQVPPERLADCLTAEQISKALEGCRQTIDELDRLRKDRTCQPTRTMTTRTTTTTTRPT